MQLDLRQAVDEHQVAGWTVADRSPLVLARDHMWCELRMVGARAAKINLPRRKGHAIP